MDTNKTTTAKPTGFQRTRVNYKHLAKRRKKAQPEHERCYGRSGRSHENQLFHGPERCARL